VGCRTTWRDCVDLGPRDPTAERIFHKRDQFIVNRHDNLALGSYRQDRFQRGDLS
jgi:hypothetical protein